MSQQADKVVDQHLAKDGVEKTTVHKHAMPAVEHEHIKKEQLEKETIAVDRERHQDHYQTKVQPLQDKEVLPEQHHHVHEGSEQREFQHGDDKAAERGQAAEADKLGVLEDKKTRAATKVTEEDADIVEGEHIHHHVHENIQPVIQKETIEPHVVHKTKNIKEVHQHEAQHHAAEQLPPVSLDEFKKQGGKLDGAAEKVEVHNGAPEAVEGSDAYNAPSTRQTTRAADGSATAADGEQEEPSLLKKMVMGAGL